MSAPRGSWRRWKRVAAAVAALALLALIAGWFSRERIADDVISGQLESLGLPATYEIESIGAGEQVLRNVVVGDPARPDLTIQRARVRMALSFGAPTISRIVLERPRLHGSWRGGKLSFGSLDPVIFTDSKEPFRLPDIDLKIVDGRALMETDFGPAGIKAEGSGNLRDGFDGVLAASAPDVRLAGCVARDATLYGRVKVRDERPRFAGPARLAGLACPASRFALARTGLKVDVTFDRQLDGAEGSAGLETGPLRYGVEQVGALSGTSRLAWRNAALTARYDLAARGLDMNQAKVREMVTEGRLRVADGGRLLELEGTAKGQGIAMGRGLDRTLAGMAQVGEGTLVQPVAGQIRTALARESRDSRLSASFIVRRNGRVLSVVVPQGAIRGASGETLVALSRVQFGTGGGETPRLTGNFATGGRGLPRVAGRMEQGVSGRLMMRMRMAEYRAGTARIAVPRLTLMQARAGTLGFAGDALVTGDLPGGRAEALAIPLDGNWSSANGLALWRRCIDLRFDRLKLANLTLGRRSLPVCPTPGNAIVRLDGHGLRAAGGIAALDLGGSLGSTPVRLKSGAIGFAWPGTLAARSVEVALGPAATASRFKLARIEARLGSEVSGSFDKADALLNAVPLDVREGAGRWRFAKGALIIDQGAFRLEDRQQVGRFQPLIARDATLRLADNRLTARALLREPKSERAVVLADIRHNLATGAGSADLAVDDLVFDKDMQPDTLTTLALGVIANAEGTVRGKGRIDWNAQAVTSSGSFTTDSLDFAAAFGPVKGLSGTVAFTDLLGMVTAPDQRLRISSINPGIEVTDGAVLFALKPGNVLQVDGASWPFMGGTLSLQPVTMALGSDDPARYVLRIEALDAALFVQHLELGNLAATGTFDGQMPLVFDQNGGRIDGGYLLSRPPGGNVSYVGALTYKDLSPMANMAFEALKSLDYQQMRIDMDGSLEGEILSRATFDGVTQGETASKNFLTRRIGRLPIRFKVSLRAPFFQLVSSVRSLYDPEYLRDPRELGILDAQGRPRGPTTPIQPPDSGKVR